MAVAAKTKGEIDATAGSAALLLDWWRLAGVDMLVGAEPQPWTTAPAARIRTETAGTPKRVTPERVTPERVAAPLPERAVPAVPSPAADSVAAALAAETLADFIAAVRAGFPGAPIADGIPESGVMILGEGPSAEDLRTGRPFTGPAGALLDRMLAAIGLDRSNCYISLACPLRAIPGPVPAAEMAAALPLARAHLRLAAPRLVLLLGGPPAQALGGNPEPISRQRGRWAMIDAGGGATIPALPTFNPAYLLRRPEAKREAWADLLAFQRRLVS